MTMTNQEIFDTAVAGIIKQGDPSMTENGDCRLRVGDFKCAVGMCIPDEEYSLPLEDMIIANLVTKVPALQGANIDLLAELQLAHDRSSQYAYEFVDAFRERARTIAENFELNPAVAL